MSKKNKVSDILNRIKEQADELADDPNIGELTPEEIVIIATEMMLNHPITTIEYTQPIGIVDRSRVTFMLDEEFEFPLYGEEYYGED